MRTPKIIFILLISGFIFFYGYSACFAEDIEEDNINTAGRAVAVQKEGLENFYRVSDILYRAEQPTEEGFKSLQEMGIKTVVNLRVHHSDEKKMQGLELNYFQIPIHTWSLDDKHVAQFLKIMSDEKNYPVLLHCQHGADRTGTMIAVYRMVFENWSKEKALKEMTGETYGYHSVWKNLPKYIKKFDIEKWKKYVHDLKEEGK